MRRNSTGRGGENTSLDFCFRLPLIWVLTVWGWQPDGVPIHIPFSVPGDRQGEKRPMEKNTAFAENFAECCSRSSGRLAHERRGDSAFVGAQQECDRLYRMLADRLGDDSSLLGRYDAAKNELHALEDDCAYQQGFQDCVYLLRWMGAL